MEFRVLGPIDVDTGSGPWAPGGPRQLAVLAVLLIRANRTTGADHLVEAVWERPPTSAPANLRTYIARLRAALAPDETPSRLAYTSGGYRLEIGAGELDLDRFELAADRAAAAALAGDVHGLRVHATTGMRLWRASPFTGADVESDLLLSSMYLEERHETLVDQHIAARVALGDWSVIGDLRGLVAVGPLREVRAELLMAALCRCGRRAEALAVYQALRRRLADELGARPSGRTQSMIRRLLGPGESGAGVDPAAWLRLFARGALTRAA